MADYDVILTSVKKFIGIEDDYTQFDPDITLIINSELSTLNQLNVGTEEPFAIVSGDETWSDFFEDKDYLNQAKEFICIKTKMVFDPPQNSFVMDALKEKAKELEWRLAAVSDFNKR